MGFSLPAAFTLFQKRLANHKVMFCLPVLSVLGLYGMAAVQNHELDLELLGVKPEAPDTVIAQQKFAVRFQNPQKHPPLIAITRWLSSEETQQAVLKTWQKQTHHKKAPLFTLSFYPLEKQGRLPAIVCQVQIEKSAVNPPAAKPEMMASDLSHLACEEARKTYQNLFSTPPDFNQEYAFHRLHAIESNLSQTLVALSKLGGASSSVLGDTRTLQQLENSVFYRTLVSVNQDQHQALNQRYQSVLGQVQKELPLNSKKLNAKAIGSLLTQNQTILTLEKTLRRDEAAWQTAQKNWGLTDAKTQKLGEKLDQTQTQLQNALSRSTVLASRQKRQGQPDDPENWIPVSFHRVNGQTETPAVQLEGSPKPYKIHYRPLSQREIAMLEDLRHLSGSISLASQRQSRARQAHDQASHSVIQALKQGEMREALQEKKAFLEQSYTLWSEMASRQAILKAWQQENSTGALSPLTIRYTRPSKDVGPSFSSALETIPVLDWDLLTHPLLALALMMSSLLVGAALVWVQKEPLLNAVAQSQETKTQHAPNTKSDHPRTEARTEERINTELKEKKKGFQPAQRSLSAGDVLGKVNDRPVSQWLKDTASSVLPQSPTEPKPLLSLSIANVDVEAPHLFLATLQDPDSVVSQGVQKALADLNALGVSTHSILVSGNSLLASGLAIELSRSQKTSLLELTQESGLLGYLFQMGEGQMKGCEGLSDLFLEHYTPEVLLKLIATQSGVAGLTVLPHHGEVLSPFNKQLNGWKKLWPALKAQSAQQVIAAPSLETYPEWSRIAELLQPDALLIESETRGGFDLKKLQKSLPHTQLILLE